MTSHSTNPLRQLRQARPPVARASAITFIAGLALLAAACGSGSGGHVPQLGSRTTKSGSSSRARPASAQEGAVAFARCMRSDGVPGWPDPNSYGGFDKSKLKPQQLGASSSQVEAAQRHCQHLLPAVSATQQETQRIVPQALRFSRCMRSQGIAGFPDPESNGGIRIPDSVENSPGYGEALKACQPFPPPPAAGG
jgi:hypothetical protein